MFLYNQFLESNFYKNRTINYSDIRKNETPFVNFKMFNTK